MDDLRFRLLEQSYSYCNPNNEKTRDQEAAWGKVHDPRSKEPDRMVWIYCWKVDVVVDVPTHVPIAFDVFSANEAEGTNPKTKTVVNSVDFSLPFG